MKLNKWWAWLVLATVLAVLASAQEQADVLSPSTEQLEVTATATGSIQSGAYITTQDETDMIQVLVNRPVQRSRLKALRMTTAHAADVAAAAAGGTVTAAGMSALYSSIFERHNTYRTRHQASELTWSDTLASQAAVYAARCNFAHDPSANAGENLFATSNPNNQAGALIQAIDLWYDEVRMYSFSNPRFSSSTGHFTQVVWRGSTSIGCAIQTCTRGMGGTGFSTGNLVVCRYSPPGNVLGTFSQNVLPASNTPVSPPTNLPPNPPSIVPSPSPAPPIQVPPATLPSGYKFASPGCLYSVSQQARLCMEDSGYAVLYSGGVPGTAVWVSANKATSSFRPYKLALGKDGNIQVTDGLNNQLWQSSTANRGVGPYRLVVQNTGVADIFDAAGTRMWTSSTPGSRRG